jgi:uncharacterized protein with HEPN domain
MQRDRLFLAEMVDAAETAHELTRDVSLQDLEGDRLRRDALMWNFTVLGEAAAKVSPELREVHPEIDWRRPADMRNRIVHGYWSIDIEILYNTASTHLTALAKNLRSVLDHLD